MDHSKRKFLKGAAIAGGTGLFVAGYSDTLKHVVSGVATGSSGKPTRDPIHGNSLAVEYRVDEQGDLHPNPAQRLANTMCLGCWTLCGVRARIDNESDKIVRILGNPYHPLSAQHHIDFKTPIKQALLGTSGYQEGGLNGRSTACARGNAMLEQLDSPHRVTQCLKRVGPRGSGQWQSISFEQLVTEVVEGGDLFGEGSIEGLRAIRNLNEPLDSDNPEYGPKANQLLVSNASDEGRDVFIKRFTFNSFGTRNFANHGAYCGLSFRAGAGALLGDLEKNAHLKPDWDESDFLLFMGTSPQQSGNPFKRQSRQLASNRAREGKPFSYVVVAPSLPNTVNLPSAPANRWLPIKPATDSALALAMLRWIIDNDRYAEPFLAAPHAEAAERAGYRGFCNASYLVVCDESHPRFGQMLHASDLGLPHGGEAYGEGDGVLVVEEGSGELRVAGQCERARLWVDRRLPTAGGTLAVKSSFQLLAEACREHSLEQYSQECAVPVSAIEELAREFTSHGTRAAVISHGGTMSANGFYSAWAIMMLNAMIGNLNARGGAVASGGKFNPFGAGPRYDLESFPGMVKPAGVFLSRSKFPYEKTSEYRRKKEAGQNPYPAREPWFPLSGPLLGEHLTAAVSGYPYRAKAWINHMGNPLYGQAGLHHAIGEQLKDPKVLPLFVSIDSFINESSALSDYIVPDTLTYESWGWATAWHGVMTKVSTGRWPVVEPRVVKTAEGDPVCMESFFIAVAKRLGLPGFGEGAVKGADGSLHTLNRAADFSLYGAANVAYLGEPVPAIEAEGLAWSGVERILPILNATLSAEEAGRAAYLYARGGRFEPVVKGRD
ncbi:molybdopterin-dependent oxidoreductase, partial [Aeromonas molluscorum]